MYLRVTTDVAMQRISMRDRSYERNMEYSYIEELNLAYEDFFEHHDEIPFCSLIRLPLISFLAPTTWSM